MSLKPIHFEQLKKLFISVFSSDECTVTNQPLFALQEDLASVHDIDTLDTPQ